MGWIAGGVAASGLLGAGISAIGQSSAAGQQAKSQQAALQFQESVYNQNTARLQPWVSAGTNQLQALQTALPGLTAQFNPTMAQLQNTPGYQFALNQGLQATQNGQAASGLGNSGSALKGAEQYAQGLASTTYQQQFQNYLSQNSQIYNMLSGVANTGENAAAQTGTLGINSATGVSNALTGLGNAQAAGIAGVGNTIGGAFGNMGAYGLLGAMLSKQLSGPAAAPTPLPPAAPVQLAPPAALPASSPMMAYTD